VRTPAGSLCNVRGPAPVVAGISDHSSALAAQRPREPEAGEDAGVEKLRDRGDPRARLLVDGGPSRRHAVNSCRDTLLFLCD
jgi:hypothetical protein